MDFFKKLSFELLAEESPTERLKSKEPAIQKQITEIKSKLRDYFTEFVKNFGRDGLGSAKHGEDFRIPVKQHEDEEIALAFTDPIRFMNSTISFLGLDRYDLQVKEIPPGEPEAKSRLLYTYKIFNEEGIEVFVVLSKSSKAAKKEFAPNKFKIEGKEYSNYKDLVNELESKIENKKINKHIKEYLLYLLALVDSGDYTETEDKIIINKDEDFPFLDEISANDKNNIQNDFGEILCGIILGRVYDQNILFPSASNEPLVDVEVGNYNYSVKSMKGAAATLTAVSKAYLDVAKNLDVPKEEKDFIVELFEMIGGTRLRVEETYVAIAKTMDEVAWDALQKLIPDIEPDGSIDQIKDTLDLYQANDTLRDKLTKFYDAIDTYPSKDRNAEKYGVYPQHRHGYVISPLSYYIAKVLNQDYKSIKTNLATVLNQEETVRQINFYNRKDKLEFIIKKFDDEDIKVKFEGGGSINLPGNQNLRFKIL